MILNAILLLIYYLVYGITYPLRYLGDVVLPENIQSAIESANGYISSFGGILPIGTLLTVLGLVIGVETAIFTYKLIMWIIRRFPTQS